MADDMLNEDGTLNTEKYYYRPGCTEPELKPEFAEATTAALPAEELASTEDSSPKRGSLPDDFPHVELLRAAGVTTYAKARNLKGDYSPIEGIGEARGSEIEAALNE